MRLFLSLSDPSYVGGGVRGGEVLCVEMNHLAVSWGFVEKPASEDLPTGLAEVLRQEGVEDGVDTGVSIRQAMGDDA